jgi:quinol monooxygenase YgiN
MPLLKQVKFRRILTLSKKMNKYLLHGKLTAKQGSREELANILLEASKLVSTAKGCKLYVIGLEGKEANSVFVTEI